MENRLVEYGEEFPYDILEKVDPWAFSSPRKMIDPPDYSTPILSQSSTLQNASQESKTSQPEDFEKGIKLETCSEDSESRRLGGKSGQHGNSHSRAKRQQRSCSDHAVRRGMIEDHFIYTPLSPVSPALSLDVSPPSRVNLDVHADFSHTGATERAAKSPVSLGMNDYVCVGLLPSTKKEPEYDNLDMSKREALPRLRTFEMIIPKPHLPLGRGFSYINCEVPCLVHLKVNPSYLQVVDASEHQEYKLPVFHNLRPLSQLMVDYSCYPRPRKLSVDDDARYECINDNTYHVSLRRYASRLTTSHLAIILGLHDYHLSLTRLVEKAVVDMFEQLTGVVINEDFRWPKIRPTRRKAHLAYMHRFTSIYFPTFTEPVLDLIMRRASYVRAQLHLKSKRTRRVEIK